MFLQKVISLTQGLEDPKHPLLGPTIKGLYLFGLWQTGSKFRTVTYNIAHSSRFIFLCCQLLDLYTVRNDLNKVLNNMSLTVMSFICALKYYSFMRWQKEWRALVAEISQEEMTQLRKRDPMIMKLMNAYKKYTRVITYLYWVMVFGTNLLLIITPLLKYASSKSYREDIKRGDEPLPQILPSWFPFDNTKMPGYLWGVSVHAIMCSHGSGALAVYDMTAVAIMSYLKGQVGILKETCKNIFGGEYLSDSIVVDRIKECHRHHTVLVKHYKMFNTLLSPTMYLYVLFCSITICASVVQFTSSEATTSQKVWVIQYSTALVSQLFLYCWHSNEVAVEIMKGSYSFYTLFSQMQGNK